jgi:hypothetical protein
MPLLPQVHPFKLPVLGGHVDAGLRCSSLLSIQYFNETKNLLLVLLKFCVITNVCQSISIYIGKKSGCHGTWMGMHMPTVTWIEHRLKLATMNQ